MKKIFAPFIALLILASCAEVFEKTIEYEIPREPDKITIDARLIAGDSIFALLGTSAYSMGKENPVSDNNFTVKLFENDHFIENLSASALYPGYFVSSYKLTAGGNYKIEASRDGFETITGEDFLEPPVEITTAKIEKLNNGFEYDLVIDFKDPPGQGDYYYFYITVKNDFGESYSTFSTIDPNIEVFDDYTDPFDDDQRTWGSEGYLSDLYFDGKTKKLNLTIEYYGYEEPNDSIVATFNLFRISEDYYLHEKSKAAHEQSDGIFSEPVQIYSNIVNGYGIVAGGTPTRIILTP